MTVTQLGDPTTANICICTNITGSGASAGPSTSTGTHLYLHTSKFGEVIQNLSPIKDLAGGNGINPKNGKYAQNANLGLCWIMPYTGKTASYSALSAIQQLIMTWLRPGQPAKYFFFRMLGASSNLGTWDTGTTSKYISIGQTTAGAELNHILGYLIAVKPELERGMMWKLASLEFKRCPT